MAMETVSERMRAIGLRLAFGLSEVAMFGLGSIGAFLAFDWPPILRQVVLTYLVAAVVLRRSEAASALATMSFSVAIWACKASTTRSSDG
jgi:hypothetical protein